MRELWVAVCDDLEEERLSLARMIRSWARSRGLSVQIRSFSSGEELLNACRQPELYQFVFLDIFMPGLSGIETARRLRASGCNMSIIYATTSVDHGVESFETRAADYLVKPFREEDVARALDWCLEHLPERLRTLPIYAEGEWLELPLSSIRYIEVLDHHCQIHTLRQTVVTRRVPSGLRVRPPRRSGGRHQQRGFPPLSSKLPGKYEPYPGYGGQRLPHV